VIDGYGVEENEAGEVKIILCYIFLFLGFVNSRGVILFEISTSLYSNKGTHVNSINLWKTDRMNMHIGILRTVVVF
jgi:hypothetical protein